MNRKYARYCLPVSAVATISRRVPAQAASVCHGNVKMPRSLTDRVPIAFFGVGRGVMNVCPGVTVFSVVQSRRWQYRAGSCAGSPGA